MGALLVSAHGSSNSLNVTPELTILSPPLPEGVEQLSNPGIHDSTNSQCATITTRSNRERSLYRTNTESLKQEKAHNQDNKIAKDGYGDMKEGTHIVTDFADHAGHPK